MNLSGGDGEAWVAPYGRSRSARDVGSTRASSPRKMWRRPPTRRGRPRRCTPRPRCGRD